MSYYICGSWKIYSTEFQVQICVKHRNLTFEDMLVSTQNFPSLRKGCLECISLDVGFFMANFEDGVGYIHMILKHKKWANLGGVQNIRLEWRVRTKMQCYTNLSHSIIKWVKGLCGPHGKNSIVEFLREIPWPKCANDNKLAPLQLQYVSPPTILTICMQKIPSKNQRVLKNQIKWLLWAWRP